MRLLALLTDSEHTCGKYRLAHSLKPFKTADLQIHPRESVFEFFFFEPKKREANQRDCMVFKIGMIFKICLKFFFY